MFEYFLIPTNQNFFLSSDDIEWPSDDEWVIQAEAKDIITALLQQNARNRLGSAGPHEVKEHPYFYGVDWNSLLRQKAEFVPQLENDEDTSYFDCKSLLCNAQCVLNLF